MARKHDINSNLLYRWRVDPRYSGGVDKFLPIEIDNVHAEHAVADFRQSELGVWISGDVHLAVKGDIGVLMNI